MRGWQGRTYNVNWEGNILVIRFPLHAGITNNSTEFRGIEINSVENSVFRGRIKSHFRRHPFQRSRERDGQMTTGEPIKLKNKFQVYPLWPENELYIDQEKQNTFRAGSLVLCSLRETPRWWERGRGYVASNCHGKRQLYLGTNKILYQQHV